MCQRPRRCFSVRFVACEADERVGRARASLSLLNGVTFQADDLLRAGPVEVVLVDERGRRSDRACLAAESQHSALWSKLSATVDKMDPTGWTWIGQICLQSKRKSRCVI